MVGLVADPVAQPTHGLDEASSAQLNVHDSTSAISLTSVVDITGIDNHSDDVVTAQLHSPAVTDNDMETTITCHYDACM